MTAINEQQIAETAKRIASEGQMISDAREAKSIIEAISQVNQRVMSFQQRTGATPQNVIMAFAMKELGKDASVIIQ